MKATKRFVSVILALLIAVSAALPSAFAAEAPDTSYARVATIEEAVDELIASGSSGDACDCGHCPVVVLPGLNHSPTYLADENDAPVLDKNGNRISGTLFILDPDKIIDEAMKTVAVPLLLTLITQRDFGFTDAINHVAQVAFSIQATNPDGTPKNNLICERYALPINKLPATATYDADWVYRMVPMQRYTEVAGEDHAYFFTFPLIGDPMKTAAELDEYIQIVKSQTGHSKVNLLSVSLGGTIFTAYVDAYGWEDINEVVEAVAVHDGSDLLADFYARNFNISDEFLYHEFLPIIFESENVSDYLGYLVNIALRILPKEAFRGALTRAMDGIIETFLRNDPQFWALVPSDRYPALADRYLSDEAHRELRAKTDRFYEAQLNLKDNILGMVADGVNVNIITGCNLDFGDEKYRYFAVAGSTGKVNSDGVIQFESTSIGGTGAVPGTTFPADYRQKTVCPSDPSYSYISPDRTIDVSTCILPDNTWVMLGQHHEAGDNDVVLNLGVEILLNDDMNDVHYDPIKWPQFNGAMDTKELRRYILPQARRILASTEMTAEQRTELQAAIAQGESVIYSTIADENANQAAVKRIKNIFIELGILQPEQEVTAKHKALVSMSQLASYGLLLLYGHNGFSDGINPFSK